MSPDELLARVTLAKTEVRKGLLRRYMQALDESEGLQGITTRLSQRLGIGEHILPFPSHSLLHSYLKGNLRSPPGLVLCPCPTTTCTLGLRVSKPARDEHTGRATRLNLDLS